MKGEILEVSAHSPMYDPHIIPLKEITFLKHHHVKTCVFCIIMLKDNQMLSHPSFNSTVPHTNVNYMDIPFSVTLHMNL